MKYGTKLILYLSLLSLVIFCSCTSKKVVASAPKPSGWVVHSLEFGQLFNWTQSADDVVRISDREMHFRSPESMLLVKKWKEITNVIDREEYNSTPDCRVVLMFDNEKYAFDYRGEYGTVNGKSIKYSEAVKNWFGTYILPLVK